MSGLKKRWFFSFAIRLVIYTVASDSEGTLGSLVDLGPLSIGRHLQQALEAMRVIAQCVLRANEWPRRFGPELVRDN